MPSEYQVGSGVDHEQFEALQDDIGEDPARFLDHDFRRDDNAKRLALARIGGIDDIATVRAWIAVERALDRGPRDAVLRHLEKREETLAEIGERPQRLIHGPRLPPHAFGESSADNSDQSQGPRTAHQKLQQIRADGGEK